GDADDDHRYRREDVGVGKPTLAPVGQRRPDPSQQSNAFGPGAPTLASGHHGFLSQSRGQEHAFRDMTARASKASRPAILRRLTTSSAKSLASSIFCAGAWELKDDSRSQRSFDVVPSDCFAAH